MKRKVLGKGIEAIISSRPATSEGGEVLAKIAVEDVYPNPYQPRKNFSPEKIAELADSIRESGMIQPIVVYREDDKYYLLVGERRWRAAQVLKWGRVPAIVKEVAPDDVVIGALVENIQREDLNAIEIAEGIEVLIRNLGLSQEAAADKLGMNRSTLTNYLRLLRLPGSIKDGIIAGEISPGHARPLLSLENDADRLVVFEKVTQKRLSVRQTEVLVQNLLKKVEKEPIVVDPDVVQAEQRLARLLATKVHLKYQRKGAGKIEIHFANLDEFQRIYNLLKKE